MRVVPYAGLDGLRLYYERSGKPDLLFVHGSCSDRSTR
jgi:hypothetical protein